MYVSLTQPTWPPSPPPTSPMPLPRRSPPLPYTTLFRSSGCVESAELGKARRLDDATGRYIEFCKSTFPGEIDLKGLKLVVDCAHGAAYHAAPDVFHELGAEVVPLAVSPNGFNINDGVGAVHSS